MHRIWSLALSTLMLAVIPDFAQPLRPFTVNDDIEIALFGGYQGEVGTPILISPDGGYAAVHTERGLLKENRPEDEVRIYSLEALRRFVNEPDGVDAPAAVWTIRKSTSREGTIISKWHWLRNS